MENWDWRLSARVAVKSSQNSWKTCHVFLLETSLPQGFNKNLKIYVESVQRRYNFFADKPIQKIQSGTKVEKTTSESSSFSLQNMGQFLAQVLEYRTASDRNFRNSQLLNSEVSFANNPIEKTSHSNLIIVFKILEYPRYDNAISE